MRSFLVVFLSVLALALGSTTTMAAASTVGAVEGEALRNDSGRGISVRSAQDASAGRYLEIRYNTTVSGTVSLTAAATRLVVRARTDTTTSAAQMTVAVDGRSLPRTNVSGTTWAEYGFTGSWAAGRHTVRVTYSNACCRNLLVDVLGFTSAATTPSTPTPSPSPTPPASAERTVTGYVTGYSWYDNDPPGSAAIAYPVLHQQAGGVGSYADPVTVAVRSGTYAVGTRLYFDHLDRYGIVEDLCGSGCTATFDVWVDGRSVSSSAADQCMARITGTYPVIINPAPGKPVTAGPVCG